MYQSRKNFRKNLTSSGRILIGGEELDFINYDVSVNGIQIELLPGKIISEVSDVEALIKDAAKAEVYVQDLNLSGEVELVWARLAKGKIMLGLKFTEVIHTAEKSWWRRKFYRKKVTASGFIILNKSKVEFKCQNISADGMVLSIDAKNKIEEGNVLKILSEPLSIKALATVIWVKKEIVADCNEEKYVFGVRYLKLD